MSSGAIPSDYLPEEHAPDPVSSHGDPTPPGKVGIWLFLASEVMFFIGILGTYIILRSGQPRMFGNHAAALSMALTFMGIKAVEYTNKFTHYTVIAKEADGKAYIYDGHAHREGDALKLNG